MTLHCPSHCPSHCPFLDLTLYFHCLSLTFHCLSSAFRYMGLARNKDGEETPIGAYDGCENTSNSPLSLPLSPYIPVDFSRLMGLCECFQTPRWSSTCAAARPRTMPPAMYPPSRHATAALTASLPPAPPAAGGGGLPDRRRPCRAGRDHRDPCLHVNSGLNTCRPLHCVSL